MGTETKNIVNPQGSILSRVNIVRIERICRNAALRARGPNLVTHSHGSPHMGYKNAAPWALARCCLICNKRRIPKSMYFCIISVIQYRLVIFKLNSAAGQPLYLQLMQQIRHAIETGVLDHGDVLPGIRTLAEELVVSPNTIAKAYSELEHEGLLDLRHGSGAYVTARRRVKSRADSVRGAQARIGRLVEGLRDEGFADEEIHRMLEAELFYEVSRERKP